MPAQAVTGAWIAAVAAALDAAATAALGAASATGAAAGPGPAAGADSEKTSDSTGLSLSIDQYPRISGLGDSRSVNRISISVGTLANDDRHARLKKQFCNCPQKSFTRGGFLKHDACEHA